MYRVQCYTICCVTTSQTLVCTLAVLSDLLIIFFAVMEKALQHFQGSRVGDISRLPPFRKSKVVYNAETLAVLSPKQCSLYPKHTCKHNCLCWACAEPADFRAAPAFTCPLGFASTVGNPHTTAIAEEASGIAVAARQQQQQHGSSSSSSSTAAAAAAAARQQQQQQQGSSSSSKCNVSGINNRETYQLHICQGR